MKNKKFLKTLAAMAVGTVMVAGSLSLAACTGGGHTHTWKDGYVADGAKGHYQVCTEDESHHSETKPHDGSTSCSVCGWTSTSVNPQPGEHSHSYTWVDNEDGTHTGTCANTDNKCDAVTVSNEAHDTTGTDGACSKCGYKEGGGVVTPPATKAPLTINISSDLSGNVADEAELVTGSGIYAVGALTRNTSTRDIIHPSVTDGKITSSHRLQLGSDSAGLKIQLSEDATVLIYASGSNGTTAGSLQLYEGETAGAIQAIGQGGVPGDVGVAEFAITANTEYTVKRVKDSGTINIVFIAIHYGAISENKGDLVAAVPAQCGVAGMKAHYLSDYGRYYAEDGTTIKQRYELVEAALTHDYSLVAGSVNAATETTVGSAQIKCSHETTPVNVELPVLSSPDYTTRPAAGESGTYTYVYQGVTITFTATGVGEAELTYTPVYELTSFTGVTVGTAKPESGNGVYATSGTAAVQADGSLLAADSSAATTAYVALGTEISSGIVKISGSMKIASANGGWTCFQIKNAADQEIVGIRTLKDGNTMYAGYRADGSSNATKENSITISTSESFTYEIIINLDTKKVTITFNSTKVADNVDIANGDKAMNIASVMLNVNSGRTVYLNSVTIATQD